MKDLKRKDLKKKDLKKPERPEKGRRWQLQIIANSFIIHVLVAIVVVFDP